MLLSMHDRVGGMLTVLSVGWHHPDHHRSAAASRSSPQRRLKVADGLVRCAHLSSPQLSDLHRWLQGGCGVVDLNIEHLGGVELGGIKL